MVFKAIFFIILYSFFLKGDNDKTYDNYFTEFAINTELDIASEIGKKIILKGGSAVDAAISSAIAIGIVNSFSSGIGGGGFMLIMKESENPKGQPAFDMIDFREIAPENLNEKMFSKESLIINPGLTIAVPGEIMGFYKAHQKYGKLKWKELFSDNIKLAKGFLATPKLIEKLKENREAIFSDPGLKRIYTRNNELIKVGDHVSRLNYSHTLKKIAKDPMSFYRGDLAQKIVKFLKTKSSVIQLSDLYNYEAIIRDVIKTKFYDYDVFTTNLPTSGIFVSAALKILERLNIRDMNALLNEKNSYYMYHMLIETIKFVLAARENFEDPMFMYNPNHSVSKIISDEFALSISRKFKINHTLPIKEYGFKNRPLQDYGTTHLNVIDKDRNVALLTTTINSVFGSKILDPETGIIFNNHILDFTFTTDKNSKKLSNMLDKRKRPMSSASPMILINKKEILIVGGAGGYRIVPSIIFFFGYYMAGHSIEECIKLCRIHTQINPNKILIESALGDSIIENLKALGHDISFSEINTSFTSIQAIQLKKSPIEKPKIYAVSDKRKGGRSAGK